jgi:tripartite-type tricarboxylate transporter receptor subunit TctC
MIDLKKVICALVVLAALDLAGNSMPAQAASYPSRPIKLIVPFAAGGVGDVLARILGERASAELGQPVIIDNRSGGNTVIGTQAAARSAPDGYTVLQMTTTGSIIVSLQENIPYDLNRDFAPVIGVGSVPLVLAVPSTAKIHAIADLVALARSTPNGINYATGGSGSLGHLAAALLVQQLKIKATHVPYRGNSAAMQGLLGTQVQFFFATAADAIELAKAGGIQLLAVTSDQRLPSLPDVPTMTELGFAHLNPTVWYGYVVPANTPADVVDRLYKAFAGAAAEPGTQERLNKLGVTTNVISAPEFGKFIREESVRWRQVIQENKITLHD